MAIGPCRPNTASCLTGPPGRPCRAYGVLVPGLRPKAWPVGRLAVPCRPLGTTIFTGPCRPIAQLKTQNTRTRDKRQDYIII